MKVALVHDWLTGMRGGEKCLEVFCEIFPQAHLYTLLHVPGTVSKTIESMDIRVSPLQKMPFASTKYRYYLPLFPRIVDHWSVSDEPYDLVLSSSHCVAKALKFPNAKRTVCYCFTPMRYLWCQTENYYRGNWRQTALNLVKERLKKWDLESNEAVQEFIGISDHVSDRIRRFYKRDAKTIYPPVSVDFYQLNPNQPRKDYYLVVGALEPYKRVDLTIEAFRQLKLPLKIVGKGTMLETWRKDASLNIEFLGWRSDEEIRRFYQEAKALIFPGEEDFGIVPLEAQACGCPVIAYGIGGVKETVEEDKTGLFFSDSSPESLMEAIKKFEMRSWDPLVLRAQAEKFGRDRFRKEMELNLNSPN
jgi:glycosyltransferase involved in cell wall biosynthesis